MFKVQSSRIVPAAPTEFTGTLNELFERHAKHVLADPCEVEYQHSKLLQWCGCTDPVFYVRKVKNLERGTIYTTRSGVRFRPSDNAPAWWMHSLMFNGIRDVSFDSAPTRMFGIRRAITGQTINSAGWHVAHIFNVNDGNTTWEHWDRAEVLRRFIRNIHPCNYFYIPKTTWRAYGCDSRVIGFFAAQYRRRYLSIWEDFFRLAGGTSLPDGAGDMRYAITRTEVRNPRPVNSPKMTAPCIHAVASYRASRLTFKADVIEPLTADDVFEVVTPVGRFRMTKADFEREFPGVRASVSYRSNGTYNYPTVPARARRYLVSD